MRSDFEAVLLLRSLQRIVLEHDERSVFIKRISVHVIDEGAHGPAITETRRVAASVTNASCVDVDSDTLAAAMDAGSSVVDADNLAAAANADILATVTLEVLVESFFTFRPFSGSVGISARVEEELICFSPFLCLWPLISTSARELEDPAIGFSTFFLLQPIFTS